MMIVVSTLKEFEWIFNSVVLNLFEAREHFWLYEKFAELIYKINDPKSKRKHPA